MSTPMFDEFLRNFGNAETLFEDMSEISTILIEQGLIWEGHQSGIDSILDALRDQLEAAKIEIVIRLLASSKLQA